jgi:hypothetical protein
MKWKLISVYLGTVLILTQDGYTIYAECAIALKIIWTHLIVLLRDVGPVEARIGPFGDKVNLNARSVHGLRQMYHRLGNHFERTRWYSYVTWVKWKVVSIHLETMLISTQDRCTVCVKCTIGSEIILDAPDDTPT